MSSVVESAVFSDATFGFGDRSALADMLTEAFFSNPAHTFIYPNEGDRYRKLRWLMATNLRAQLTVGTSFGARSHDGKPAAMAFWHPPGTPKASAVQLLRFGFFSMPFRHGLQAFQRMLKAVSEIERKRAVALAGRESWYLNNMAVSADFRGRGLGRSLLRKQLADAVDPSGLPASLSTQRPENVSFYKQLGFRVAGDGPIGEPDNGFSNWIMIYEPQSKR